MRSGGVSCAFSATASIATRHSSTSNRFAGTRMPRDGSSSRWLARPMRWIRRVAPLGAPTLMTRSMSPQSTPRSSEEVHTTARRRPLRHRGLDLAALRHVERAVMQRDREVVVVHAPQLVEDHLGLAARVDEHERGAVLADQAVDVGEGVARRMAGPGQVLARLQHGHVRRGAGLRDDEVGAARCRPAAAAPGSGRARPAPRRWPRGRPRSTSGARRNRRARPSDRRSPRLAVTTECSSSSTMRRSVPNSSGPSGEASSSASCSGVVSRMSGGSRRWRWRARGRRVAGAGLDADRAAPSRRPAAPGCGRCRRRAP